LPAAYACYVAASRIVDYKHRPADVVAGALVGLAAAAACDGGVSFGASPSSGVKRGRVRGSAREDESQLRQLVESRI
jgi:membrane-associated phospholipid phosphatase